MPLRRKKVQLQKILEAGCWKKMWEKPPASMIAAGSRSHKIQILPKAGTFETK
jgi:hypothetical protein